MEEKYPELHWPNKRIPAGGVFHYPKAKYSPEVHQVMKTLMDESKLTLMQRRQVDWCLRTGSALSDIKHITPHKRGNSASEKCTKAFQFKLSRRRPLTAILESGDFERERYKPLQRNEDREKLKEKLQDVMEFGAIRANINKVKLETTTQQKKILPSLDELVLDLISQIKERTEWLRDMEMLGEGAKHKDVIQQQIEERLRRIKYLKPKDSVSLDTIKNMKNEEVNNITRLNSSMSKCSLKTNGSDKSRKENCINKTSNCCKLPSINSKRKVYEENISDIVSFRSSLSKNLIDDVLQITNYPQKWRITEKI